MTPNGQLTTQYPQPLQTSGCTYTLSNSVRTMAPVGQLSRQPARTQCLQTSEEKSHEKAPASWVDRAIGLSIKATCRQVDAPRATVLSYDMPVNPQAVVGQLVPLFAGNFAGLAPDAECGIGEEAFAPAPIRGIIPSRFRFKCHRVRDRQRGSHLC